MQLNFFLILRIILEAKTLSTRYYIKRKSETKFFRAETRQYFYNPDFLLKAKF